MRISSTSQRRNLKYNKHVCGRNFPELPAMLPSALIEGNEVAHSKKNHFTSEQNAFEPTSSSPLTLFFIQTPRIEIIPYSIRLASRQTPDFVNQNSDPVVLFISGRRTCLLRAVREVLSLANSRDQRQLGVAWTHALICGRKKCRLDGVYFIYKASTSVIDRHLSDPVLIAGLPGSRIYTMGLLVTKGIAQVHPFYGSNFETEFFRSFGVINT